MTPPPEPTAGPAEPPPEPTAGPADRPPVDVVIPFAGSAAELSALIARAALLTRSPRDTVVVVDNRARARGYAGPRAGAGAGADADVRLLSASERRSSYHARNRGAAAGRAPWLLFLDADVEWPADLIDAYFECEPSERVAVLAGAVTDATLSAGERSTPAERYAAEKGTMAQDITMNTREHPAYAQTANCLVRRAAFESAGGFAGGIRSGGDADLCFRLQAAGWTVEQREGAGVVHRNRRVLLALLAQKARHGAGAAWLQRRHPGTFPPRRRSGLARWSVNEILSARRDRVGAAPSAVVEVLAVWAFELGRLLPNRATRRR